MRKAIAACALIFAVVIAGELTSRADLNLAGNGQVLNFALENSTMTIRAPWTFAMAVTFNKAINAAAFSVTSLIDSGALSSAGSFTTTSSATIQGTAGIGTTGQQNNGTLVIQSTSTTNLNPIVNYLNNVGASVGAWLQNGQLGIGTLTPASTSTVHIVGNLSVTGIVQMATLSFNDGSSMSSANNFGALTSTSTWSGIQTFLNNANSYAGTWNLASAGAAASSGTLTGVPSFNFAIPVLSSTTVEDLTLKGQLSANSIMSFSLPADTNAHYSAWLNWKSVNGPQSTGNNIGTTSCQLTPNLAGGLSLHAGTPFTIHFRITPQYANLQLTIPDAAGVDNVAGTAPFGGPEGSCLWTGGPLNGSVVYSSGTISFNNSATFTGAFQTEQLK